MKALPMKRNAKAGLDPCEPHEATHVQLHYPGGPYPYRLIPVENRANPAKREGPLWTWNGDTDKPTLHPSILTRGGERDARCHSFVQDGKVKFLRDCEHELAGQTVDLLDVD